MTPTKTMRQRELELQALLGTPAGRKELEKLESRYQEASGRPKAGRSSTITYLLVHEREHGLISG